MNNQVNITLLPDEISRHVYDSSVTLATIFAGQAPIDFLPKRCGEILAQNPWLAARLRGDGDEGMHLDMPANQELSPFYQQVRMSDVCESGGTVGALLQAAYQPVLGGKTAELFCKQGFKCLDQDEALFKVRLCLADDGLFVLLVSMSHVAGDGATLYNLYKMLSPELPVAAMNPRRAQGFQQTLLHSGCVPGSCWLPRDGKKSRNPALNWLLESRAMRSTRQSRAQTGLGESFPWQDGVDRSENFGAGLFEVNGDWLAAQKAAAKPKPGLPWVSSNDVLCSWFMNACRASLGVMAVDARGRVGQLSPLHAGNYQVGFLLGPEEYRTPEGIRSRIARFPGEAGAVGAPGPGESVALTTNWSKFYRQIDFGSGCRPVLHFPLVPPQLNTPSPVDATMIVFCPREGELAAALAADGIAGFLGDGALGSPLFPA